MKLQLVALLSEAAAVYADTKIVPLMWKPSPLGEMVEKFNALKYSPEYQDFLGSGVKVLGVWDDHDYGMNNGGKHYGDRLQAQGIYLDFLDEPTESLRRRREGAYVSYSFGSGSKSVKLILLDTRSHLKWGLDCDILGTEQWAWLERQLNDPNPPRLTIIGSGIQVLSDMPYTDRWTSCPSSYDRLMWLLQRNPRVILISGDVHFGEFACLNNTSTGYPLYEVTSSGLTATCVSWLSTATCTWLLENILTSSKRTHPFITELNYGFITIHWNEEPVSLTVEVRGKAGNYLKQTISLDQLEKTRDFRRCPQKIADPPVIKKLIFYIIATCILATIFIGLLRFILVILKIILIKIVFPLLGISLQSAAASTGSQHAKHKNKVIKSE
ncbi:uncharacterized protein LOC110065523 isoform X2 [Orbicella faveolata]|uniref:uncharacterized protein LOC110065523 isoform X2 n=1 Tax=Orbicella faveolata TaxID=48498 RepID=UPI0009E4EBB8|nr:uncharacterized protein LOC110065523 isoform X2 [Orbicella faveolata]